MKILQLVPNPYDPIWPAALSQEVVIRVPDHWPSPHQRVKQLSKSVQLVPDG